MPTHYSWQKSYEEAVLETDDTRLHAKLEAAQAAIDARLLELSTDGAGAGQERIALIDALKGLGMLRKERDRAG